MGTKIGEHDWWKVRVYHSIQEYSTEEIEYMMDLEEELRQGGHKMKTKQKSHKPLVSKKQISYKGKSKKKKGKKAKKYDHFKKCATTHPKVKIMVGNKAYYLQGGSCTKPEEPNGLTGVDVFIGLDYGMETTTRCFPWNDGVEFLFRITDMSVPNSIVEFQNLLDYMEEQILAGKRVFVGCIGGHGRTGLVLSALVHQMTGNKDSTKYLRKTYCENAVESEEQIKWLYKHFGINKVDPVKGYYSNTNHTHSSKSWKYGFESYQPDTHPNFDSNVTYTGGPTKVTPVQSDSDVFKGLRVTEDDDDAPF